MAFTININKNLRNTSAGQNGTLKAVNGVNGVPISIAPGFPDLQDQFNQMGITDIRLHDTFGIGDIDDGFVANRSTNQNQLIPNVPTIAQARARTFIADFVNKRTIFPYAAAGMSANNLALARQNANYAPTDSYLKRILDNDPPLNPNNIQRQILLRIGRNLDGGYEIPANFDIYANLVADVVRRYAVNYQSIGLPRKVTHWEIWNEPDLTFFWNNNNPQIYYQFYAKVANAIKAVDPSAKVGGCGVANGYNPGGVYIDGLLNYCQTTNTPIDFLSWHYYGSITADPQNIVDIGNNMQTALTKYGYSNIESICTEWNSSPFGVINTFSKVQSATNAAYIASTFMYMQYCKVDRAHYYRGDGSSFGLFNDNPSPTDRTAKSFCTYAAQSFGLFSKMLETPYILGQDNNFTTGLTTLAAENSTGNQVNILAANYQVNRSFVNPAIATGPLYRQHYLDTNRTVNQLTDDWSKNEWFGGVDPNTITYNNTVTQRTTVTQIPINDSTLRAKTRNYTQSNTGVNLHINNIATGFTGYKLTAYRIREGGRLDRMTPEEVTTSITASMSNGTLNITDTGATVSTVTLYSIELIGSNTGGGNTGGGNTGGGNTGGGNTGGGNTGGGNTGGGNTGGGNTGGGNTGGGNTGGGTVTFFYTISLPAKTTRPLNAFLPPNYVFIANKTYILEIDTKNSADINLCSDDTNENIFNPSLNSCQQGTKNYTYNSSTFIPSIGGILYNDDNLKGSVYISTTKDVIVSCTLSPL